MRLLLPFFLMLLLVIPVGASGMEAPVCPDSAQQYMPDTGTSFAEGTAELLQNALSVLRPDLQDAIQTAAVLIGTSALLSLVLSAQKGIGTTCDLCGALTAAALLLRNSRIMIPLSVGVIDDLSEYGKLFIPVLSTALAAQGGVGASSALYLGTAFFNAILCRLIRRTLIPMVYLFLAASCAYGALGEDTLKRMKEQIRKLIHWSLKTTMTLFISYMSITGVVSGTVDSAKMKAVRTAISAAVPVIGGTLADASESILVGAALVKNGAGVYGIYAMMAVFLAPFLRIGCHFLILKWTGVVCSMFDSKRTADLIEDFSSAMGFLLAMTGSICVLLLISTVCFLKGGG